jgi:hypothetical protein
LPIGYPLKFARSWLWAAQRLPDASRIAVEDSCDNRSQILVAVGDQDNRDPIFDRAIDYKKVVAGEASQPWTNVLAFGSSVREPGVMLAFLLDSRNNIEAPLTTLRLLNNVPS